MKVKKKRTTGPSNNTVSFTERQGKYIPTEIDMALKEMEEGAFFIKVRSKHWKKTRFIELSEDHLSLYVSYDSCGSRKRKTIDIKKISDIRVGYQSPIWERLGKHQPASDTCFSLVLTNKTDPLNLVAITPNSAKLWIRGLQHLNANLENLDVKGKRLLWIWEHFREADKDQNDQLCFKEICKLLNTLNFQATSSYVKANLKEFDVSGDALLSFEEFTEFFKKITWRPEIERLYKSYCDADLKLQPSELCRFMVIDQGLKNFTVEMAQQLIQEFEPDDEYRSADVMSVYGFTYLLTSDHGDIFNINHRKVMMDMHQPLSYYYIASSHNTYLSEDQLFGKSSVECYVRAFERGCRCVELDCWDGDDEQPIIYHGYTLTSKISFYDVIEVVRDYAFKESEYPVILSIENHCSIPQQNKMAQILKDLLGSKLLTRDDEIPLIEKSGENLLPSPEALKGKVLVKGKALPLDCSSDGEVSEEDEAADVEEDGVKKKSKKSESKIKLSQALSNCVVYAISRHFKDFPDSEANSDCRYISSLNEDKAMNLAYAKSKEFSQHTRWQLARIYPKGSRTNSSNYHPLDLWNVGCQIVALNYQTEGEETYINQSRFRTNGSCGYVLKPPCLLAKEGFDQENFNEKSPFAETMMLQIRIISAQQLPKPPNDSRDVIDPYVVVSIMGCKIDQLSKQTSVVENNGFNPAWVNDPEMKFRIVMPSLAFVQFKVMDKDSRGGDDLVGLFMLPVSDIATGYRHVHLQTTGAQTLSPATLFVHIALKRNF